MKKNVLLISGGGGTEHDVSLISAGYLRDQINKKNYHLVEVLIDKDGQWKSHDKNVSLDFHKYLQYENGERLKIDFAIPCIHGPPGETGDIQSFFEIIQLPYLGCNPEASTICFNKISTKLWLEALGIQTTPFTFIYSNDKENLAKATSFFEKHKNVFVKASSQGSSVGCYPANTKDELLKAIDAALKLSSFVVIEETINGRELEISGFEYKGQVHVTIAGEIVCPNKFYSFDEKYSQKSQTTTHLVAPGISSEQSQKLQKMAKDAFTGLKLKDLSRIDFFLTNDGRIYINEINTFPGMTPISMFPKMMENSGVHFSDFLEDRLTHYLK